MLEKVVKFALSGYYIGPFATARGFVQLQTHNPRDWVGITRKVVVMPNIRVKENEPFDVALRRFKRAVEKTGLLTELRAREFYEKPTAERKRKHAAAVKRRFKRLRSQMLPPKLY